MLIYPAPDVPVLANAPIVIEGILLGLELDGVRWKYTNLEGWGMGGEVRASSVVERPGEHGTFDTPVYRGARVVVVEGILEAETRRGAKLAEQELAGLLADGRMGTFTVLDPDLGDRSANVRLSGQPQSDGSAGGVGVIGWQLQFTAPDHRKYGEQQSDSTPLPSAGGGLTWPLGSTFDFGEPGSSGSVTLTNDGTAPTEPTLTVRGGLAAGFLLTQQGTGRQLLYPYPVGTDVVIDCREGTVTSAGQDRLGLLTVRDWFSVDPGEQATFTFTTLGAETADDPTRLTVALAPAYH